MYKRSDFFYDELYPTKFVNEQSSEIITESCTVSIALLGAKGVKEEEQK
jgi:hypothetical protein